MIHHVPRFQSTLPRRERPIVSHCAFFTTDFNPRSHEGSDMEEQEILVSIAISIHAPTKGATSVQVLSYNTTMNFNPRSHEGSDSNFIQFYILYFSISINLYQYFPSYFLSLPSPYNFCTFILVRVLLHYRVHLPFAQQSYNKNIIY